MLGWSFRAADASPKQMTPTPEQPDPPPAKRRARSPAGSKTTLSWLAMALLTLGSVGDLGATPATAVLGLASVVIYVLPAIVFLLPASLVSAELASGWQGGVYNWVSEGISPRMGFVAIWCQFAQTTFYYPALLAYVASTLAYVFAPSLAHSGLYTTRGDHRPVLVGRAGLRQRAAFHRQAGVVRDPHRNADPRPASRPPGRDLPPAGQRLGGAAERPPRAPGVARADERRADRQQLLPVRRG